MSKWISVKERLPTSSAKYIACVRDRNDAKWTVCADWSCEMRSWRADSMSKWISVKERLPTSSAKYIACVRDRNDAKWTVCADWSCEMRSWFGEFGEIKNKVTHWMPLPDPPKEG